MPRVPDDPTPQQDSPGQIPGVRVDDAPNLVRPLGNVGAATNEALQKAADTFEQQKRNADDAAVQNAYAETVARKNKLLYNTDPKSPGALTQEGQNAFGIIDQYSGQFKKELADIRKNMLNNPEQQRMFDHIERSQTDDMNDVLQKHVFAETKKVAVQASNNAVDAATQDAVKNYQLQPDKVGQDLKLIKATVTDQAMKLGEDPAPKVKAALSDVHTKIIRNMLANQQDVLAKNYYDQNKDDIVDEDGKLQKDLQEGSVRGESQRLSDSILSKQKERLGALDEVKNIKDPKVRDMTEERINKYFTERKQAETELREDNYMKASKLVDQNPNANVRDIVPPDTWNNMTPEHQEALMKRSNNPQNDDHAWLDFVSLGQKDLSGMTRAQFETDYWSKFDSSHRERAEKEWMAARKETGGGADNPHLSHLINFNQRVLNTLSTSGLIPNKPKSKYTKEEANEFSIFETEAANQIQDFESKKGSKSSGEEQQKILDDMVKNKVFIGGSGWFGNKNKPAASLTSDEMGKAYVPVDKIPPADLDRLKQAFKKYGKNPSQDDLEQAYGANLTNDGERFKKIIGASK